MTTLTAPLSRLRWTFTDGSTLIGRELGRLRQEPGQIVAALIFPVVMVVLFGYVFGSAIQVPDGGDYRNGAAFTFIAVGDPQEPATVNEQFNTKVFHFIALPNDPINETYK